MQWPERLMVALIVVGVLVGCDRDPAVRTYQVAKQESPNRAPTESTGEVAPGTDRMLVGMVTQGARVWFIKTVGDAERIGSEADQLRALIEGLKFDDRGEPQWKLPPGWSELPGNGIRFATLMSGEAGTGIEVTVISLPAPQDVLGNVNRWRGQLGLGAIDAAELDQFVDTISGDGFEAHWIDLTGSFAASRGMAPFAGGAQPPRSEPKTAAAAPASEYEVPPHWQPGRIGGMRKAAFQVEGGEGTAEITVITLGAAGGSLLPNVNRWRGQIGLGEVTEAELQSLVTQLNAGSIEADYVQLVGEVDGQPTSLFAVTAIHENRAWFFKIMGDSPVVEAEKEAFERFVRSAPL